MLTLLFAVAEKPFARHDVVNEAQRLSSGPSTLQRIVRCRRLDSTDPRSRFGLNELSAACVAWWILGEPFSDAGHMLLKVAGCRKVENPGAYGAAILEVMRDASWGQYKCSLRRIHPAVLDKEAHRSLKNVKDVIFRMRVRPRTLRIGLKPPL
nr:hypothetical protein [Polaromonas sp. JS666]